MIANFVSRSGEFDDLMADMTSDQRFQLEKALITVLYSNRYKKQDNFVTEMGIDFTLVRGVLYKYNEDSKSQLLQDKTMAQLFVKFSEQGREFLLSKPRNKSSQYATEVEKELTALVEEARHALNH